MAFNLQTFKTRTLTAIVFAVVMLVGLLWNIWSFIILFTIIHFGCWWEFIKLIEKIFQSKFKWYYKTSLMSGAYAIMLSCFFLKWRMIGLDFWNYLIPVFAILSFIFLLYSALKIKTAILSRASFSALCGVLYISIPLGLLIWINRKACFHRLNTCDLCMGYWFVLCIIFSLWINDTMAYIVGSLIGKTPLSKISPKKTWEGTIGGAMLCIIIIGLLGYYLPDAKYVNLKHWVIIASIVTVFGTLGDLLESKLKRMAGVKDSGSIMPGHGGFLDRFDSLLIATPFVFIYVYFFIR